MGKQATLVVALIVCSYPLAGHAAPAADGTASAGGPPAWTEEELLSPLDRWIVEVRKGGVEPGASDPQVGALLADLGAARARRLAVATPESPAVELGWEGPGEGNAVPEETQTELVVAWQPPRPDRRRLEITAAEAGVEAARARLAAELWELRLAWRRDFARWSLATARAERLAAHGARLEALAERTARRAGAGEASGLEARRMALAAAVVAAERGRAEAERSEARAAVRAWRPDLPPDAVPVFPSLPPLPSPGDGTVPAAVVALEAELREARLEAEAAKKVLHLPRVAAGWQRREVAGEEIDRPVLGLSWPIPLFDRDRPRWVEARARARSLESRLELLRRRLEAEHTAAREAYAGLRRAALGAEEAAHAGPPAVAAATAAFTAGELDLTALLETLAADRAAAEAALDLAGEALAAHRRLERLRGAPVPPGAPTAGSATKSASEPPHESDPFPVD